MPKQVELADPVAPQKGGRREEVPGCKLGWAREREVLAEGRSPYKMIWEPRGSGNVPVPFPGSCLQVKNTLTTQMGLLEQDQVPHSPYTRFS